MLSFSSLKSSAVKNKNVIVRVDINVPIVDGVIQDDTRIKSVIPTIKYLVANKAKVIVISHFDRPEGKFVPEMSLKNLVRRFEDLLGQKITFIDDCIGEKVKDAISSLGYGQVVLLENLRFYKGETKNDPEFAKQLASIGDLYVNDAFSCSHRAHASIVGIAKLLESCPGFLLESEIDNLQRLLAVPKKPMMAIVGGSKVSTKIDLINSLIEKAEAIFIAGGMANTFLYALGNQVGKSLCEKELKETALKIISDAAKKNCQIILPKDAVVCKKLENNALARNISLSEVGSDDIIVDAGRETIASLREEIVNYRTVVWNGPLGAFEFRPFHIGTESLAKVVANLTKAKKLISVAGGGDIVSALNSFGLVDKFTYISTAGGAFLEWLEGKSLPGVEMLMINKSSFS